MAKYVYKLTNGKTLVMQGDTQPDDADVEQAAQQQGVTLALANTAAGNTSTSNTSSTPVSQRPLLTGLTDAGAAAQFSDPSAMQTLNDAKNRAANYGIAAGAGALGDAALGAVVNGARDAKVAIRVAKAAQDADAATAAARAAKTAQFMKTGIIDAAPDVVASPRPVAPSSGMLQSAINGALAFYKEHPTVSTLVLEHTVGAPVARALTSLVQ